MQKKKAFDAVKKERQTSLINQLKNKFSGKVSASLAWHSTAGDITNLKAAIYDFNCNNFDLQFTKTYIEKDFKGHRGQVDWGLLFKSTIVGDQAAKTKVWCGVAHGCIPEATKKLAPYKTNLHTHFSRYACKFYA